MSIARDKSPEAIKGNGSRDPGAGNGQASEPIFVHWSCPTPAKPKPSRTVVVAVELSNSVASLVAITPPHYPVLPSPHWDQKRRELWVNGVLVKKFCQPSPNQETILAAFQEEGWPSTIDDPLPPDAGLVPKRRLHFTIQNLNRGHQNIVIRFEGDGTGQGVTWKRLSARDCRRKQRRRQRR